MGSKLIIPKRILLGFWQLLDVLSVCLRGLINIKIAINAFFLERKCDKTMTFYINVHVTNCLMFFILNITFLYVVIYYTDFTIIVYAIKTRVMIFL